MCNSRRGLEIAPISSRRSTTEIYVYLDWASCKPIKSTASDLDDCPVDPVRTAIVSVNIQRFAASAFGQWSDDIFSVVITYSRLFIAILFLWHYALAIVQ
jgi:hypothetical protein